MDMDIKDRIRYFRKSIKKMTQDEFRKEIHISRSNLASIETGVVNVTDRLIDTICDKFNVNEEWLRNGTGEIFKESESQIVAELVEQYQMTPEQKKLMEIFLSMSDDKRQIVAKAFFDIIEAVKSPISNKNEIDLLDQEIEEYRTELLAEKEAASHSVTGNGSTGSA